jgi:mono/diheme cytochrome c family protein
VSRVRSQITDPLKRRLGRRTAYVAVVFAGLAAQPAAAANPNSVKGLVADHCSKCHWVTPYSKSGLKSLLAPPFKEMANHPKVYTDARLRTFLRRPHYPMAGEILSNRDIDNLIAFIHGLRDK